MTIKTIEASLSVESISPIGLKRWDGLRMIAEIDDTENKHQCSLELKQKLESILGVSAFTVMPDYPPIPSTGTMPHVQPVPVRNIAAERVEICIEKTTTIDELKIWEEDAKKFQLQSAYDNKLKQLT